MADSRDEIYARIPHRPPFLWVDRIVRADGDSIETEKDIPVDLDVFRGHYPGRPIMPGVLLCEALFQTGALLLSRRSEDGEEKGKVPVLTRILAAKFKREVRPGDRVSMTVTVKERVGPAWFMKGRLKVAGRTALQVEFACALAGGLLFLRRSVALVREPGPARAIANFHASLIQLGLLLLGAIADGWIAS